MEHHQENKSVAIALIIHCYSNGQKKWRSNLIAYIGNNSMLDGLGKMMSTS
jgi:hypothetical protein